MKLRKYWMMYLAAVLLIIVAIVEDKASGVDLWMDVDIALAEVPVNLMPLSTDGTDIDSDVNFNETGMVLIWNFSLTSGGYSATAVTPTDTGGDYDWVEVGIGSGMFTIEIPATGGASANNDTEGFGWFTGVTTANLPWRGPVIGFRKLSMNNMMIDNGTAQDHFEDSHDGTTVSVASQYSDAATEASITKGVWDDPNAVEKTEIAKIPKSDSTVSWNDTALASIEAEAYDALESIGLDHLVGITTGVAAGGDVTTYVVDGSILSHLMANADTGTFDSSVHSLVAIIATGNADWATGGGGAADPNDWATLSIDDNGPYTKGTWGYYLQQIIKRFGR